MFPDLFSKGSLNKRFCLKLYGIRAKYLFSHRYSNYSLVLLCHCLLLSAHIQLLLSPWTNHAIFPELSTPFVLLLLITCIDMLLDCGRNPLPWSKSCQQNWTLNSTSCILGVVYIYRSKMLSYLWAVLHLFSLTSQWRGIRTNC